MCGKLQTSPDKFCVQIGSPSFQTFFEYLGLALAISHWGKYFCKEPVAVIGDNTGSLQNLLSQSGHGMQLSVAKELAWRKAKGRWLLDAGHLPTEANTVPYALSRLAQGANIPHKQLGQVVRVSPEEVCHFWKCTGYCE